MSTNMIIIRQKYFLHFAKVVLRSINEIHIYNDKTVITFGYSFFFLIICIRGSVHMNVGLYFALFY